MSDLDKRSIVYLPGVGPKRAEILKKEAGIASYEDLLYYFPYKYVDRSRFYKIAEVTANMPYIQLRGRILFFDTIGGRTDKAFDCQIHGREYHRLGLVQRHELCNEQI